jgi:hypothetical protein
MQPLDRGFNAAILHIASRLFPIGFDVSPNAPDGFEALKAHLNAGHRMIVWSGGSSATIYGDPEVNFAFRAWHDFCHWRGDCDYSLEGEIATCHMQCQHLVTLFGDHARTRWWATLLSAEIIGQGHYFHRFNRFPDDQRDFITTYVANPNTALMRPDW